MFNPNSIESKVNTVTQRMNVVIVSTRMNFERTHQAIFNDEVFTPKQVLEGLGKDADKILKILAIQAEILAQTETEKRSVIPEGVEFVKHEDGSISVTKFPKRKSNEVPLANQTLKR